MMYLLDLFSSDVGRTTFYKVVYQIRKQVKFMDELLLHVPELNIKLVPGCRVRLGRFDLCTWVVQHGWYSWGGNRPFCGWYLQNVDRPEEVKPLQKSDLDDIYICET